MTELAQDLTRAKVMLDLKRYGEAARHAATNRLDALHLRASSRGR